MKLAALIPLFVLCLLLLGCAKQAVQTETSGLSAESGASTGNSAEEGIELPPEDSLPEADVEINDEELSRLDM